jgi:hypothetical protein
MTKEQVEREYTLTQFGATGARYLLASVRCLSRVTRAMILAGEPGIAKGPVDLSPRRTPQRRAFKRDAVSCIPHSG